ncbi:hypothetical protein AHAS_Ahas01G0095900 [Arachis hypogaea]
MTGTPTSSALHPLETSTSTFSITTSPPTPTTSTTSLRPSSTTILWAHFPSTSFANSNLEWTLSASFLRPLLQAISTKSNVAIAAHMETKVIIEYLFGEEVEENDWSDGQCGVGDDRAEEEGDHDDDGRFMGSIEDDKYLRDIVICYLSMNWLRTS